MKEEVFRRRGATRSEKKLANEEKGTHDGKGRGEGGRREKERGRKGKARELETR